MNKDLPLKTNQLNVGDRQAVALVSYKAVAGESDAESLQKIGKAMEVYTGVSHKSHASRDLYSNLETNISVRNEFTRRDYEYFRPSEALPYKQKDIIGYCMEAYRRVGIIKNVIDLMSDFGTQGITLVHSNPRIQKLFQDWFYSVGGPERSERFLNLLYRAGNVICKRTMGKLPSSTYKLLKTFAAKSGNLDPDMEIDESMDPPPLVIPWRYNFLNPYLVDIVGGELAQFVGRRIYVLKLTPKLKQLINYPNNKHERGLVAELPNDILQQAKRSDLDFIILPQEKLQVFHYKKDDWQDWADPMLYSILEDIIILEKMKLADLAALDGAISQVRLWRLGNIEAGLFPTDVAVTKLMEILLANPGGGAYDVIWGPDLQVESVQTDVHQFLGKTKYEPCLQFIYGGLGVPPTLTGSNTESGTTNNYISLKTLVQRLEYGRRLLVQFWNKEIELFRKAMSIRLPASVRFDRMVLSDEAAEKALLVQMWDRNLVSDATILERFGEDAGLELLRTRRENRERGSGTRLNKAGPYTVDDKQHDLKKAALQRLLLSPKQAGIEDIEEQFKKNPFLDNLSAQIKKPSINQPGPTAVDGPGGTPGRPKNSKDSTQRTRKDKPRVGAGFATLMSWAREAQDFIGEIIMPGLLQIYGKENMRQLSGKQYDEVEYIRFAILANLEPFVDVTVEGIHRIMDDGLSLPNDFSELYNTFCNNVIQKQHREPTIKDKRIIQLTTYSLLNSED